MIIAVPAGHKVKTKESETRDKYQDLARQLKKKLWNMKVTVMIILIDALERVTKRIGTGTGGLGNKWTSVDHPSYSIINISQNTKESPGDLGRFSVIQTPARNHQLTMV